MKISAILLLILQFVTVTAQNHFITDDLNIQHQFENVPQRIISLAPNITEMIYEINVENKLVGNTKYCYFPEEAKDITKVGDMLTFNYEKIIELEPDLIFITVEGNQKTAYEKLIDLGLKVFVSNPRDFDGIKKTFTDMGKIFNRDAAVEKKISEWDSTYNYIKSSAKKFIPKQVMILVELNPIMVAGKNTFINSYIQNCNMVNFAEDVDINYPVFSREAVVERDPSIIVYPSSGSETITTLTDMYPEWNNLSAVKNKNVFFVDRDLYFRPGPRFINALEDFYMRLVKSK